MTLISHCRLFEVPEKAKFRVAVSDARAPMSINTIDSLNFEYMYMLLGVHIRNKENLLCWPVFWPHMVGTFADAVL